MENMIINGNALNKLASRPDYITFQTSPTIAKAYPSAYCLLGYGRFLSQHMVQIYNCQGADIKQTTGGLHALFRFQSLYYGGLDVPFKFVIHTLQFSPGRKYYRRRWKCFHLAIILPPGHSYHCLIRKCFHLAIILPPEAQTLSPGWKHYRLR